ncbi:MAG: glycosyltransferase [Clostridia bacterium]|nr:glycosyltransferase [Clostridia bacterium]
MKKIFFAAYDLDLGGIETALITLINRLSEEKEYEITLGLEKKEGIFLEDLDKNVKIIEYRANNSKIVPLRKAINFFKRLGFIFKYKNKFDFSASYATYSLPAGFMARTASKNNALWVHADYLSLFDGKEEEVKHFFENVHHEKYKNIVFVSNEAREAYLDAFPERKTATAVINNIIDYEKIRKLSQEEIEIGRDTRVTTFINVGRHYEKQKRVSRIIEAAERLKVNGLPFRVLLVGDGEDTDNYKQIVKEKKLENEVIFLGRKKNPYPYFKISDCLVLSSDYEGYPVVFVEAFTLGLPIITTDVSDSCEEIQGRFGYVTYKKTEDIYEHMKKFIEEGYMIQNRFDPIEFNSTQIEKLKKII